VIFQRKTQASIQKKYNCDRLLRKREQQK